MSNTRSAWFLSALLVLHGRLGAPAQDQAAAKPAQPRAVVSVKGEVEHPLELTEAEFAKLPRQMVHAKDHDGKEADYEGVAVVELLKAAGVKLGQDLRGKALARYLIVEASDGYRAVFALPEIDPAFSERVILLADRRDKKCARRATWAAADHCAGRETARAMGAPGRFSQDRARLSVSVLLDRLKRAIRLSRHP